MTLSVAQQAKAAEAYIRQQLAASPSGPEMLSDKAFSDRLRDNFITIYAIYTELYGYRDDCLDSFASLIQMCYDSWLERGSELRASDKQRELEPEWFMSNKMLGGVCYVDRYATNLDGVKAKIPYFQELGLTYLHLMPLFLTPEPKSDGGYAVSSYRIVKPALGTIEQLRDLATELRRVGISLVVDLVFNHTSSEHEWARKAESRDGEFESYYWIFNDRSIPQEFERSTREIFPDDHPGSFVQLKDGRWVWSTFYHFQWDLNYSNPAVFRAMAAEMLYLSNVGIDVFRMDAVAFMWKRMGTTCESLPEVHKILRAFNAICRLAAPSVLFKSEAIVHPDQVVSYIDNKECQLSYNPLQMALGWEALATRNVAMLSQAIERRHNIKQGCSWVNYVRSHDDIGWTFADEDAAELGMDGFVHRKFLNAFYVNRHPGSFARGVPFQDNPKTGDCRISGTTASLAGLENGESGSIGRILLLHSIAMSSGGIPLIYLGDEVGQLNDYGYLQDPSQQSDSRWVHRPSAPDQKYSQRQDTETQAGQIFAGFRQLIKLRKETQELAGGRAIGFYAGNSAVLGYTRPGLNSSVLCLANFSDHSQLVHQDRFAALPRMTKDLISGDEIEVGNSGIYLKPHQYAWLKFDNQNPDFSLPMALR